MRKVLFNRCLVEVEVLGQLVLEVWTEEVTHPRRSHQLKPELKAKKLYLSTQVPLTTAMALQAVLYSHTEAPQSELDS